MRQFARMGSDALLDETALCMVERLGLRPVELTRLRMCDVDLVSGEVRLWGKGDRRRRLPLPSGLSVLLRCYVENRRPAELLPTQFAARATPFLRRCPTADCPDGIPVGRAWLDGLFPRLLGGAPQLDRDDLSLYSYRHAIASWVDANHGRGMTRRILGHTSRLTATDQYVHVSEDDVRQAIVEYENHLLAEFGS
jgi:integrase